MAERFSLLVLDPHRAQWATLLARQCDHGEFAADMTRCASASQAIAVLNSGQFFSALLTPADNKLDPDLELVAESKGCSILLVGATVDAGYPSVQLPIHNEQLVRLLARNTPKGTRRDPIDPFLQSTSQVGALVVVIGTGNSGASTLATQLAIKLRPLEEPTLLVDGQTSSSVCMRLGLDPHIPSLSDFAETLSRQTPTASEIQGHFTNAGSFDVLPGLRHCSHSLTLTPARSKLVLDVLAQSDRVVVLDVDNELSITRRLMDPLGQTLANQAIQRSQCVVAVSNPTMKGVWQLTKMVADLVDLGVDAGRIQPVLNRVLNVRKTARSLTRQVAELLERVAPGLNLPTLEPELDLETALRRRGMINAQLGTTTADVVNARAIRPKNLLPDPPQPIRPGSLKVDVS